MKHYRLLGAILMGACLAVPAAAGQRIGAGAHYWRTVDSLDNDSFDRDGVSYLITYQGEVIPLVKYQTDLEIYRRGYAGSRYTVYAPQALAIVGGWVYGGVGIGILYADSRFANKPFYLLRAGLDLPILPRLRLDINANYHFSEWRGINRTAKDIESDTITIGGALRFAY